MDAMILAAGRGTRLLPLTRRRPKPLFPILNRTLLRITLDYLETFSVNRVVLNTHHLAPQVESFIQAQDSQPLILETRFETEILGTAGGIGNTRGFWRSDPFLVINGDIVTDIDLQAAVQFHREMGGPVTLIVQDYPEFNRVSVDSSGRISHFRSGKGVCRAFTGIHVLDRRVFDYLPASGCGDIISVYQRMIDQGVPVWAFMAGNHYWRDIGTPRSYLRIHEEFLKREKIPPPFIRGAADCGKAQSWCVHPRARLEEPVDLEGWGAIGSEAWLKKGCRVAHSVIWERAVIEEGIEVRDSIIGEGVHLRESIRGEAVV